VLREQAAQVPCTDAQPGGEGIDVASVERAPSISRSARPNVADVPDQAGLPGAACGRQRRQGRKPASRAAAALGTNRQFSRRGVRAGQIGRQKMPVERTATKKRPSKRRSRVRSARSQRSASSIHSVVAPSPAPDPPFSDPALR
jgi:hypothetical protein